MLFFIRMTTPRLKINLSSISWISMNYSMDFIVKTYGYNLEIMTYFFHWQMYKILYIWIVACKK